LFREAFMSQKQESQMEPDFDSFMDAVCTMEIGRGVDSAACHHSAVEIQDWHRIQKRLEEAEATEAVNGASRS